MNRTFTDVPERLAVPKSYPLGSRASLSGPTQMMSPAKRRRMRPPVGGQRQHQMPAAPQSGQRRRYGRSAGPPPDRSPRLGVDSGRLWPALHLASLYVDDIDVQLVTIVSCGSQGADGSRRRGSLVAVRAARHRRVRRGEFPPAVLTQSSGRGRPEDGYQGYGTSLNIGMKTVLTWKIRLFLRSGRRSFGTGLAIWSTGLGLGCGVLTMVTS